MKKSLQTLLAWLSLAVAAYAIAAYAVLPLGAVLHPDIRLSFAAHVPALVYLHVFAAAAALLLGPLQFRADLRARWPTLHRGLGRVYLALGVGLGGLSGLALAANAYGGAWSRAGFATLALLWLATGVLALQRILRGDVAGHRRWMARNFALTLAAVTLRLYLPAAIVGGLSLALAYPVVAWLCWLPNLALAEWLLSRAAPAALATRRAGGAGRRAGWRRAFGAGPAESAH
ncbi:conserved membrane hypothetical protein [Rubrivivax sp. A210]|uniref:DUF2306 domain-containing protein n=1 Tax=Rubrivivax sp. A210 TaxID=2772301 RepID=UPI00191B8B34|nr:DUF2306 domain-containing protein [Rubrivivax sp. A210]CAD5369657.1 conserved membrane hypothetical protein [Rubrivivax sp. A210]